MRRDTETIAAYLRERGVVPDDADLAVESLGGGVSNRVFRVEWDGGAVVVKQPFANLAVKDDWPADVSRVHNEAAAARTYAGVLDRREVAAVEVPSVQFEDWNEHVIVISAAPKSARMWKADLLGGQVDTAIAETVGEFLAAAHRVTAGDEALRCDFENYTPFQQLRLAPYHETVAERHPDVAKPVEREIERIRETRTALVHGDYSPKNVLVDTTVERTRVWILDFEVAHWGDPAFDVAFMLNHLFIKSVYNAGKRDEYLAAVESFWESYTAGTETRPEFETAVVRELGVLMLARVDGKSPVEYIERTETKNHLRTLAKHLLNTETTTLQAFIAMLRTEVDDT